MEKQQFTCALGKDTVDVIKCNMSLLGVTTIPIKQKKGGALGFSPIEVCTAKCIISDFFQMHFVQEIVQMSPILAK